MCGGLWWVLGTCLNEWACLVHHKAGTQYSAWNAAGTWSMVVRWANAGPWCVGAGVGWRLWLSCVLWGCGVVDYVSGRVRGLWPERHLGPLATFIPHVTLKSKPCGWSTGPRVPTLTCLRLSFHVCAMGVTITALLAARNGCESTGVAATCGKS